MSMTDDDLARLHVRIIAGDTDAYTAFEVAPRLRPRLIAGAGSIRASGSSSSSNVVRRTLGRSVRSPARSA
jgi:hypothetical protein